MAILSISEAARAAGIARSTIQRAIKDGRLSTTRAPDGTKGIDTAELYRVFGEPRGRAQDASTGQREAAAREAIDALQQQLEVLRQELDAARGREQWYREQIEQEQRERRALEQRLLSAPPKRGLIRRLVARLRQK